MAWLSWLEMNANASVSLAHQDWPVSTESKFRVSRVGFTFFSTGSLQLLSLWSQGGLICLKDLFESLVKKKKADSIIFRLDELRINRWIILYWVKSHRLQCTPCSSFLFLPIKEWSTAVGPAGPPGHRALGVEGQGDVLALIPVLGTGAKTVSENPLRRLTVKTKTCST